MPKIQTCLVLTARLALTVGLLASAEALAEEPKVTILAQADPADPADPDAAEEPQAAEAKEKEAPPPRRSAGDSDIEEIVVLGAESEATSDFGAADSVTGFGAEDLAALGAQDIADLADFTPNLEIVTSGATTPTFFIRGVGLNDFNPNSTGAVAIYVDDVPINAPAIQLGTLYDVEAVNVLRGPQGTGLARNASAGAIKMYTRKPTGEFGGYLRSELGDYSFRDFEGAIEAPIYEDLFAGRFAFRFSERDGTMKNRCANAVPFDQRVPYPPAGQRPPGALPTDPPWSQCGEPVVANARSDIPDGLPDAVNDIGNWAARGTILFQPTLDMSWLISAHGSKRDEWSRLGQSYGTNGFYCLDGDIANCYGPRARREWPAGSRINNALGTRQTEAADGYWAPEVEARFDQLDVCSQPGANCTVAERRESQNEATVKVAKELADDLDSKPWAGDFNMCTDQDENPSNGTQCQKDYGRTTNDTWGGYVKGDIALPHGLQLNTVTGYDRYDRLIDIDLDFSPQRLFQIRTDDQGWQVTQDVSLQGRLDEFPLSWEVGGAMLHEELDVSVLNDLGDVVTPSAIRNRDYTQGLWSAQGFFKLGFDFWERFTLDGGFRYNWEQKNLDYTAVIPRFDLLGNPPLTTKLKNSWHAPTGTVRLTYRFREDTHVFWKYTRGWKPGTYNATSAIGLDFVTKEVFPDITVADPETIDSFETGVRGSWLEGRLNLDLSFFYYSYQDYQIFTAVQFADSPPQFVILNANNAEVYGAELDLIARPWLGALFNVRFGWLESQFLDFVQVQQARIAVPIPGGGFRQQVIDKQLNNTGNPLLNSPRFKVSLTAEQTLPLGRWGSITGRYDGVWTDTTYFDATEGKGIPNAQDYQFLPDDTIAQRPYWLHNLRLSYLLPGGEVELAAWVRNLTNKAYKTFAFDASTFSRTTIYFVGDPRTIGGTLIVNF